MAPPSSETGVAARVLGLVTPAVSPAGVAVGLVSVAATVLVRLLVVEGSSV